MLFSCLIIIAVNLDLDTKRSDWLMDELGGTTIFRSGINFWTLQGMTADA
jgi:hypothetical protein